MRLGSPSRSSPSRSSPPTSGRPSSAHPGSRQAGAGAAAPDEAASSGAATPPHGRPSTLDRAAMPISRAMTTAKDAITRLLGVHPRRAVFLVSAFPTPLATFAAASAGALGVSTP
jgi:hypothetical protein